MEDFSKIIIPIIAIVLICVFWKPLLWLALIILILLIIFGVYVLFKANKIKKEIDEEPTAYFESQTTNNGDVIDVEYTESEVKDDK